MKNTQFRSGTYSLILLILCAMMTIISCKKEKLSNSTELEEQSEIQEEDLAKKPKVSPNFGKERLICEFGNWAGDWLNYENGNASKKFDMTVMDTAEIEVSSKWDTGKGCYALDTNAQKWLYESMSDSVNDAINKVNLNGLQNPFVVAVAIEILKPDYSVYPVN